MTSSENIAELRATIEALKDHISTLKVLKEEYNDLYKQEKANNLILKAVLFCLIAQRRNEQ